MNSFSKVVSSFMVNSSITKEEFIEAISSSVITEESPMEAFRLAMGDKIEQCDFNPHAVSDDASCIVNHIFKDVSLRYGVQRSTGRVLSVEISYIEAGKNGKGKFFLFWETLVRICKHFGVMQIRLCDRASAGFWTHHGFSGNDGDSERTLVL